MTDTMQFIAFEALDVVVDRLEQAQTKLKHGTDIHPVNIEVVDDCSKKIAKKYFDEIMRACGFSFFARFFGLRQFVKEDVRTFIEKLKFAKKIDGIVIKQEQKKVFQSVKNIENNKPAISASKQFLIADKKE
jgi:hypothetical protein